MRTALRWASFATSVTCFSREHRDPIIKFEAGCIAIDVQAGRLVDVAPEIFAEQQLFLATTSSDATAFDLFLDAADDAAAGRRHSERLDAGVLDVLARTRSLFVNGGTRLRVTRAGRLCIVLDANTAQVIRTLAVGTPAARISRVRGVLDAFTVSTKRIALRLADGGILRGFAGSIDQDRLKALLGTDVVVEGSINFRASGEALRIEVDSILAATPGDVIWAPLPTVEPTSSHPRLPVVPVGLDALFGKWPGHESDRQLAEALRDLS